MNRIKILLILSSFLFLSACSTLDSNTNLSVKKSLSVGFKPYGVTTVNSSNGEPVRTGETSFRFEVRDGDCGNDGEGWSDCKNDRQRHEYSAGNVNGEIWFNWSLYIPDDFKSIFPATVTLGQFHQHNGSGPPFMFQTSAIHSGQKSGYNIDRQMHGSTLENKPLLTDAEMRGRWTDILVHANWKTDYRGFFRIYVNGETVPRYQYVGPTIDKKGGSPYFKFGIYQSHISRYLMGKGKDAKTPTQVVYYDNVKKGSTCTKASVYFDCAVIEAKLDTWEQPVPPPVYERSAKGIKQRFACWMDNALVKSLPNLPTQDKILALTNYLEGKSEFVSHFRMRRILGSEVITEHKAALVDIANYVGSSEEYCASL
ncbi:MAG: heparin lyase I family protein [Oceanospirillaceae bacterium]|nr:heparin lyase I family protein [Oceanospirillaceae bacterium]